MGFLTLSQGEYNEDELAGKYQAGGDFKPIPNNTEVTLAVVEVELVDSIKVYAGGKDTGQTCYGVKAKMEVLEPEEYNNRKIFKNFAIGHPDNDESDKAKRMFVALDAVTTKGKIVALEGMPTDEDLAEMIAVPFPAKLGVIGKNNFIARIGEAPTDGVKEAPAAAPKPKAKAAPKKKGGINF